MSRSSVQTAPWLSLPLLLAAYATFSWFLHDSNVSWLAWGAIITFTLLEALLLTAFSQGFRSIIRGWLLSDAGYFAAIICGAILAAFALIWIKIFSYILVVVSAELLARLDLQNIGCNKWRTFVLLTLVSFSGLAVGIAAEAINR